jgi:hypothetical protein
MRPRSAISLQMPVALAHFDGATYHPTHFNGGLIYAPDEASWHLAHAALLEK